MRLLSRPCLRPRVALSCGWALTLLWAVLSCARPAQAASDACLQAHEQAQVDRMNGRYLSARAALLTCAQRECPQLVNNECTTWLGELDHALPSLVFAAEDDHQRDVLNLHIQLNDKPLDNYLEGRAVSLDPGQYKVRFSADGYSPVEETLSLREGEKGRVVRVHMQRVGGPVAPLRNISDLQVDARAQRLWIATYGLGAAATISFAVTLGAGVRGYRMQKHCNDDGCSDPYAEHGKSLYRAVNASAITGGVLAAAAIGTLWGALHRDAATGSASRVERKLEVGGYADGRGATVTAWGRW